MNCPQCEELIDDGAAFCGNCGLDVRQLNQPVPQSSLPGYAVLNPLQAKAESKAMVALIFSVLAMPAAIIPFLGVLLAVVGLILGTTTRAVPRRLMSNLAVGFSCLALVLSAAAFAYNSEQHQLQAAEAYKTTSASATGDDSPVAVDGSWLETKCYRVNLNGLETIEHASGSCNARAFNADTLPASSNIFTVDAARQPEVTSLNFGAVAKELVDNYVRRSLPDFTVTAQRQAGFAGSPAYVVDASRPNGSSMQIAFVLREAALQSGQPDDENIFVIVHGIDGAKADLGFIAGSWEWR